MGKSHQKIQVDRNGEKKLNALALVSARMCKTMGLGAQAEYQKTSLVSRVLLRSAASFVRVGLCVHVSPLPACSSSSFLSQKVQETEQKREGAKSSQVLVLAHVRHTEATIQICNKLRKQTRCVWSPISLRPLPPCPFSCGTLQTGPKKSTATVPSEVSQQGSHNAHGRKQPLVPKTTSRTNFCQEPMAGRGVVSLVCLLAKKLAN